MLSAQFAVSPSISTLSSASAPFVSFVPIVPVHARDSHLGFPSRASAQAEFYNCFMMNKESSYKIQSAVKSAAFALASAFGLSFAAFQGLAAVTATGVETEALDGSGDKVVTFTIPAGSTESGTATWTVPNGVASFRFLVVVGGGSGGVGGNYDNDHKNCCGGGGGAGGMATGTVVVAVSSREYNIEVGAGGASILPASAQNGNDGKSSSIKLVAVRLPCRRPPARGTTGIVARNTRRLGDLGFQLT